MKKNVIGLLFLGLISSACTAEASDLIKDVNVGMSGKQLVSKIQNVKHTTLEEDTDDLKVTTYEISSKSDSEMISVTVADGVVHTITYSHLLSNNLSRDLNELNQEVGDLLSRNLEFGDNSVKTNWQAVKDDSTGEVVFYEAELKSGGYGGYSVSQNDGKTYMLKVCSLESLQS